MTEPVKVLPMAKLLRLAREKEERERAERESADLSEVAPANESPINSTTPQPTIPQETIVESTIPRTTIPQQTILPQSNTEAGGSITVEDSYPSDRIEDKAKFSSGTKIKRRDKRACITP